ncbi:hypothetical protein DM806_11085 [Sphingobium lactosutens]|uniref:TonB-dependent receptor n=2 Tax=Sphingobium lactosutens TaxID=522773 RepID=UPI0015B7DEE8|nr:TonB-dependent receptor [Sphingobium lactosutens]NWK96199.1 hypothetical protein [Sphingobium lactosutens]
MKRYEKNGVGLIALALLGGVPVYGQDSVPAGTSAGSEDGSDNIVVTARRRDESIVDVPVSVTAVSGDQLQRANISSVADLGRVAPEVRTYPVQGRQSTVSFIIRGQIETSGLPTSDPAVGLYFAEAVQARPQGSGKLFYDLSSIQVVSGPQGTLFGRNHTGGAILIAPEAPKLGKVEGYVQGTYGNYDRRELQGALNVPLGDKVALRLAGNLTRRDGWLTNATTGNELRTDHSDSFRVSLLLEPSDQFRNVTIVDGFKGHSNDGGVTVIAVNPAINSPVNPLSVRLAALAAQQADRRRVAQFTDSPSRSSNYGVTNTSTLEAGDVTLKNIFNYRRIRSDDTADASLPINTLIQRVKVKAEQVTNEFQVSGKALDDKLDYIAGAYFFWEQATSTTFNSVFASPFLISPLDRATNESKSLFAQVDYHLSQKLSMTAGARYTIDDRNVYQYAQSSPTAVALNTGKSATFKKPTWTLSLNYKPDADTLLYVTNRRGYRSGGFNGGATTPATFTELRPEILTDYEIGFKSQGRLGGMRYRTSMSAFHSIYEDIQRNVFTVIGTTPVRTLFNAAKAHINGAQAELFVSPIRAIELTGFVGYTDAKYKEFNDGTLTGIPPFAYVPKWNYRLSGRVILPVPENIGEVSAQADYFHTSSVIRQDRPPLPGEVIPGYGVLGGRITFDKIGGSNLRVAVFGTNLTNKTYYTAAQAFYSLPFGGLTGGVLGDPRMYGVEVGYRF